MEWEKYNICQLCDTISVTYKGDSDKVVLINTSDVLEGTCLNHVWVENKNLKGQFKKTFQKDDILYSEIRPANKRFAYIDFDSTDYIASTKLMVIRSHKDVNSRFLYQVLRSNEVIEQLQLLAESRSGTFPQITFTEMSNVIVKLPNLEDQNKIVSILSSLDAKIENNNKINTNLEAQAATLFKSWFVDFEPFRDGEFVESELGMIPKGWKVGTLLDYNSIVMGQSPSGSSYNEEQIGCEFYQGCADFGLRFPRKRVYTTEPNRYAESNSVLMSVRAPVGTLNVARHRCCIGRGLASIKSNIGCDSYTLYLMKSIKSILDTFNGDGTVFGSINKKSLESIKVIVPSLSVIKNYEAKINPLDSCYRKNSDENQRLSSLRDTLLPKLMSGEIDLDNISI